MIAKPSKETARPLEPSLAPSHTVTPEDLLSLFRVPDEQMPNVYLLGSFAQRVTLYSQQVRALNLVYALHQTGKLGKGSEVAVFGAGAAGLMAAAAAAYLGSHVTLLEKLQGAMELQRSSRQRWIHPFIYDWPNSDNPTGKANLPFLDWEAAYAEGVAEQIEQQWNVLTSSPQCKIDTYWNIDTGTLTFSRYNDRTFIHGSGDYENNRRGFNKDFDLIILAIGFGVEPEHEGRSSYWSDDSIDGGFLTNRDGQEWLVSGCGDGGLTDLMRLCIHRFRHERIISMFPEGKGIEELGENLLDVHTHGLPQKPEEKEVFLSNLFESVKERYDLLPNYDRYLRRLHKPKVYLTGPGPSPYGPNSSILNRLIVTQLERQGAFEYIQGKSHIVGSEGLGRDLKWVVEFGEPARVTRSFNRVIERHGTHKSTDHRCFIQFKDGFGALEEKWKLLPAVGDPTREKQWLPGFFGSDRAEPIVSRRRSFDSDAKRLGIRAGCFTIVKQLGSDGSSTVNYQFERLAVTSGQLTKIRVSFTSLAGSVGPIKLDSEAERLGIRWVAGKLRRKPRSLSEEIDRKRRLNGFLTFPNPLTPASIPATFGISFQVFNGDALSKWEFYQMYGSKDHNHFDGEKLNNEIEYLSRVVWFPMETLKMRLTLPSRVATPPFLSAFLCGNHERIAKTEIVDEEGALHVFPEKRSSWHPGPKEKTNWRRVDDPLWAEAGTTRLANTAPQTWELTVVRPIVGSCYSLDWVLNSSSPDLDVLAGEATEFRKQLLKHRRERIAGHYGSNAVRQCFRRLYSDLRGIFKPGRSEGFEVSLMTYDEAARTMVHFEGLVGGKALSEIMWKTAIPFGLGLAGASFKEGEIFLHAPQLSKEDPRPIYIPLVGLSPHQFLISIPLDHARFSARKSTAIQDRSRQCLGVVNVGSHVGHMPDMSFMVNELVAVIQKFCNHLCDRLLAQWAS